MLKTAITLSAAMFAVYACTLAFIPATQGDLRTSQLSSPQTPGELVVHEWGTFTTFSGSDGVFLEFRPHAENHSDLPDFVFDRASLSNLPYIAKSRLRGKVRMETPVTYFYTDRVQQVDVSVDFPHGLLTEFYPPVEQMLPPFDAKSAFKEGEPLGDSSLDWGTVTLIPTNALIPGLDDNELRQQISEDLSNLVLPTQAGDLHYAQARATDSALVHLRSTKTTNGWDGAQRGFVEKFLFYRGVGNFELPITATFDNQKQLDLKNASAFPLRAAILIENEGNNIRMSTIRDLESGGSCRFEPATSVNETEAATNVQKVLIDEGLFEKEAAAMVNTWRASWLVEPGTRVLYMVPQAITDELLPLHVSPEPQQTLRVLVGRLELMTPTAEAKMLEAVAASAERRREFLDPVEASANVEQSNAKFEVSEDIRKFGRLTEPALHRIQEITEEPNILEEVDRLLEQLSSS